ncbi:MAG: gliding motility-associated C-terminal domain-containing protein [Bacteroidia bacterium]|nr:gliding motility-associated C-terminal domain-containing protein [Bacteroidia bacterium]
MFHYNNLPNDTTAHDSVTVIVPSYDQYPIYYEFYWQEDSGWEIPGFECSDIDTVRIVFAERPTAIYYFKMPPCYGDTAKIWADLSDPALADIDSARFEWTFGNDTDIVIYGDSLEYGDGPHLVSWTPADTIHPVTLRVTNQFGCMSFEFKDTIEEPAPLSPGIIVVPATCGNPNGEITLSTDSNFYTFTWLDERIPDPDDTTVTSLFGGIDGYYPLQISAKAEDVHTYPNIYCIDTVPIYIPDTGEVTAFFDTTDFIFTNGFAEYDSIVPAHISLWDLSSESTRSWRWRFYDEDGNLLTFIDEDGEETTESTEQFPDVTIMKPGVYYIQLYVSSREGCENIFVYRSFYVVGESSIEIPNVFTPNNDGKNDVFRPKAVSIKTIHGEIFNRWGRKIYEWDYDYKEPISKNGWNGKINDKDAAPGIYFYVIEATAMDEKVYEPIKGTVTLIRDKK